MIKTPNLIIDPEWLVERIHDRSVRTVDLRDRDAFADRHIPGAVQLDLEDLGESRGGCENVLLPPASFEALTARLGITDRDTVVAYDEQWGLASARPRADAGREERRSTVRVPTRAVAGRRP